MAPEDYLSHIRAGYLLMATENFADAVRAFTNSIEIYPTEEGFCQRIKANIRLGNIKEAIEDLQNVKGCQYDIEYLTGLQKLMNDE